MIYAGIDVHSEKCTATLKQESGSIIQQSTFDNTPSGINGLITMARVDTGEWRGQRSY